MSGKIREEWISEAFDGYDYEVRISPATVLKFHLSWQEAWDVEIHINSNHGVETEDPLVKGFQSWGGDDFYHTLHEIIWKTQEYKDFQAKIFEYEKQYPSEG